MEMSTKVCRNDVWKLFEINRDKPFKYWPSGSFAYELLLGNLAWEPALGNLFLGTFGNLWEPVPRNVFLRILLRHLAWEPALWNLASKPVLANFNFGNLFLNLACKPLLAWEPCFGTSSWEPWQPGLGICSWEPLTTLLGNLLLGTCSWEPLRIFGNLSEPVSGNLASEPLPEDLGNLAWQSVSGNLSELWETCLETLLWDLAWEPCLETLEPCLETVLGNSWKTCSWEPWEPC